MKLMNNKKFKYGSMSVLLTALLIVVVILLNVAITALFSSKLWYIYSVDSNVLQISDVTDTLFAENIDPEVDKIEIVFMADKDRVNNSATYADANAAMYMRQIHELAKIYEKRYEFISISYLDYENDPQQWLSDYKKQENKPINEEYVVVKKAGASASIKALHYKSFLVTDSSKNNAIYAFAGERRFTMSILSLYSGNTVAYLTTGHGEVAPEKLTEFQMILEDTGFTVKTIDLAKEEIAPEAELIVIAGPVKDFGDVTSGANEIGKLEAFCERRGNLMVFVDPGTVDTLDNLCEFLSLRGMTVNNNLVYEDDYHSLPGNSQDVIGTFVTDGKTGSGLTAGVRDIKDVKTLLRKVCTITINRAGQGHVDSTTTATAVSAVLSTSKNATAVDYETEKSTSAASQPLMALMQSTYSDGTNSLISYILTCGTSDFISDSVLMGGYVNDSILLTALRAMAEKNTPEEVINIEFVEYANMSLSITEGQANTWMLVFAGIIPVAILTTGIVIYFKRRHR